MPRFIERLTASLTQGSHMENEIANSAAQAGGAMMVGKAAGIMAGKAAGIMGAGGIVASILVMIFTEPKNKKETATALLCTAISCSTVGSGVIKYFGLQAWGDDFYGAMALGGIYFAAGVPGWTLVRWAFNYLEKNKDKGLDEVINDFRGKT